MNHEKIAQLLRQLADEFDSPAAPAAPAAPSIEQLTALLNEMSRTHGRQKIAPLMTKRLAAMNDDERVELVAKLEAL
jgi:hypothetical protein